MDISNLVNTNLINLDLTAKTKEDAIKELAEAMLKDGKLKAKDGYVADVLKREEEGTTGFGMGFAIPHGKSDFVAKTCFAVGRASEGIEWESLDGEPVNFIILIAVPKEEAGTTHLKILSKIAGSLVDDDFKEGLLKAELKEDVIKILNKEMEE